MLLLTGNGIIFQFDLSTKSTFNGSANVILDNPRFWHGNDLLIFPRIFMDLSTQHVNLISPSVSPLLFLIARNGSSNKHLYVTFEIFGFNQCMRIKIFPGHSSIYASPGGHRWPPSSNNFPSLYTS